ncbi:MAG: flagellar export chaperone FlgN [Oscillospiraceae bacterium]|jgi:hypothetical protein
MASIDEFIAFLEKYCAELETACRNETQKRLALISGDPAQLEALLQMQQAETMRIQNFENKRLDMQKALGFEGLSAKMLVETVEDPEKKRQLADVLQRITDTATDIREQNRLSLEFANSSLKLMEQAAISAGIETQQSTYSPETARGGAHSKDSSFEKLV